MKDTANKKYEQLFDENELDNATNKERSEDATLKEVKIILNIMPLDRKFSFSF